MSAEFSAEKVVLLNRSMSKPCSNSRVAAEIPAKPEPTIITSGILPRMKHLKNDQLDCRFSLSAKQWNTTGCRQPIEQSSLEMLLAQSAAIGAFADVAGRYALLTGQAISGRISRGRSEDAVERRHCRAGASSRWGLDFRKISAEFGRTLRAPSLPAADFNDGIPFAIRQVA